MDRIEDHFDTHGFGLWAMDLKSSGEFIWICWALARNV